MSKIIALLTDFGYKDGFAATLKGVIYTICPEVQIVDISHEVKAYNILEASWILTNSFNFFPAGTIFVCVVDPGVGSERKKLLVQTDKYYFIAPDNGLLTGVINKSTVIKIISLDNNSFWLPEISNSFHGRDIFAPVAAHLASGLNPVDSFGSPVAADSLKKLPLPEPVCLNNQIKGTIVYIDNFGNVITNIPGSWLSSNNVLIKIKDLELNGIENCYTNVESGKCLALIGSHNYVEISVNGGRVCDLFDISVGEHIIIEFLDDQY